MALPFLFANVSTLATPALDANYAALGALTPIPCTVAGTNTLTMTPLASTPTVASYSNYMQLTGIAISTNTSSVSAVVGALTSLPVYKDTSGTPAVLTGGEIVATCAFGLLYDSALNSGNGGFHLMQITGAGGGGGGGSPGGSNTDVQFNDSGSFGGNAGFTYDITTSLNVQLTNASSVSNGGAIDLAGGDGGSTSGDGGEIQIIAGSAAANGNGGQVYLGGGSAVGAHDGGQTEMVSGNAGTVGTGGDTSMFGGTGGSTSGNGGRAKMQAGDAGSDGAGGAIQIFSGTAIGNHNGGNIDIVGGRADGNGTGGVVGLFAGDGGFGAATGPGGGANLIAGNGGVTSGAGGGVNIASGTALGGNSNGGDIVIFIGAKAGGGVDGHMTINRLDNCINDAAASVAGVPVTGIYRNGSILMIRVT